MSTRECQHLIPLLVVETHNYFRSDSENESDDDRRTRATEQDARRRPESSTSAREQRWRSVPVVLPVPTGMKLTRSVPASLSLPQHVVS